MGVTRSGKAVQIPDGLVFAWLPGTGNAAFMHDIITFYTQKQVKSNILYISTNYILYIV